MPGMNEENPTIDQAIGAHHAIPEIEFSLPHLSRNGLSPAKLLALGTIALTLGIGSGVLAKTLLSTSASAPALVIISLMATISSLTCFFEAYNSATETKSTLSENLARAMQAVRDFSRSSTRVHVADETLEEILKNANDRTIADNGAIPNAGAIKNVFESEVSPYRLAAQSFIKALPNNASAQEIITLANSYYNDDSRATEAAKARMNNEERRDFTENKRLFSENLFTIEYGALGDINDSKISQAIFLSQVVASIKHPEKFLSGEDEAAEKIKVETIETLEKQKLYQKLEKHLLRINHKLDGNEGGKLAVCYGYQLVRDGEHKAIGSTEANHVVQVAENSEHQHHQSSRITEARAFPLMNHTMRDRAL